MYFQMVVKMGNRLGLYVARMTQTHTRSLEFQSGRINSKFMIVFYSSLDGCIVAIQPCTYLVGL